MNTKTGFLSPWARKNGSAGPALVFCMLLSAWMVVLGCQRVSACLTLYLSHDCVPRLTRQPEISQIKSEHLLGLDPPPTCRAYLQAC